MGKCPSKASYTSNPLHASRLTSCSDMLERDAFEDIRHVLAAIRAFLEVFVNLLPLDDRNGIFLLLEELGNDIPRDPVCLVLQTVHKHEVLTDIGVRFPQLIDPGPHGHR